MMQLHWNILLCAEVGASFAIEKPVMALMDDAPRYTCKI
jgi:hypothetical protein